MTSPGSESQASACLCWRLPSKVQRRKAIDVHLQPGLFRSVIANRFYPFETPDLIGDFRLFAALPQKAHRDLGSVYLIKLTASVSQPGG